MNLVSQRQAQPRAASPGLNAPLLVLALNDAEAVMRLRQALSCAPEWQVLDTQGDTHVLNHLACGRATQALVLTDVVAFKALALTARQAASERPQDRSHPPRWVVMASENEATSACAALQQGACGALLREARAHEWLTALRQARDGGFPVHPSLMAPVLASLRTSRLLSSAVPDSAAPSAAEPLSTREHEVLHMAANGHDYSSIAQQLGLSRHTVITYVRRLQRKLGARTVAQAVARAQGQF